MTRPVNQKYNDYDISEIIDHATEGVDTTGVNINIDHESSGEKHYVLNFEGDREKVNRVIRAMKDRVELKKV